MSITRIRTIIHIGQHKTGTTSIQHFLRFNKTALSKRGLYVPDVIANHNNTSHYMLNVYALNKNRFSSIKKRLLDAGPEDYLSRIDPLLKRDIKHHYKLAREQNCRDVLWTNEGLFLLNSIEEHKRLRDLFEPYSASVVCVCCFRDVDSYKKSYIRQLADEGIHPSPDKNSCHYLEHDSWLFDYAGKIKMLEAIFDRVIIYPYHAKDGVGDFMRTIGYTANHTGPVRLNVTDYTQA